MLLLGLVVQGHAATQVANQNFEGAVTGWNDNTVHNGGTTYTTFLGYNSGSGTSATQQVYKTFNIPSNTTEVQIQFDFLEIAVWLNNQFKVYVNDQEAAVGTFVSLGDDNDSSSQSVSLGHGSIGSEPVEKHRFSLTVPITPGQTTLKLGFGAPAIGLTFLGMPGYWGVDNLTISAESPATTGSLTVLKSVSGAGNTFAYTTTGTGLSNFSLSPTTDGTANQNFADLAAGSYTIAETALAGYDFTSLSCTGDTDNGNTVDIANRTVTIDLDAGENQSCTFTSTEQAPVTGSLTVLKSVSGAGNTFAYTTTGTGLSNFSLSPTTDGTANQNFADLAAGSYTIAETALAGYDFTSLSCTGDTDNGNTVDIANRTVTIDLDAGENQTCTFTSTEQAPVTGSLTVLKSVSGAGNTFAYTTTGTGLSNFSLSPTTDGTANQNFADLAAGSYTIAETALAGYDFTSLSCIGDTDNGNTVDIANRTVTIDLDAGENQTCTFTSTEQAPATGSLTVLKSVSGTGTTFAYETTGTGLSNFSLSPTTDGTANQTFSNLAAGSYTITETALAGYDFTSLSCSGDTDNGNTVDVANRTVTIDLDADENQTCTFTSTEQTGGGSGGSGGGSGGIAGDPVGTTSAKFGVTPGGAASYSIPIAMPKGTADMQPKLGMQYNSRDRNGIMGMGWKVTGLSYINRCQTNLYMDDPEKGGVGIDPVDYDDNDKFCLNGERLMAVKGTYGADGTEYRTFFEEFSKVISHGSTATGPTSFTVYKKTGEILTYGGTTDSRFQRNTEDHVRTWALSKLADAKGNYISYSYHNDRPNGEFYINRIDYTGNDVKGLAPYNHVSFLYEDRDDKINHYKAGDKITLTKRLNKIHVFTENQLAHEYRIVYGAGDTGRSRVTSITECAGTETCFKPTVFEWNSDGDGASNYQRVSLGNLTDIPESYNDQIADFNGDGRSDLLTWSSRSLSSDKFLYTFDKNYSFSKKNVGGLFNYPNTRIGDFNGDGFQDFIFLRQDNSDYKVEFSYLWDGESGFIKYDIGHIANKETGIGVGTGDFNGDGLTDIIVHDVREHSNKDSVWFSNGDGTFRLGLHKALDGNKAVIRYGDFNGDGKTDFLGIIPTTDSIEWVSLQQADGEFKSINLGDVIDTNWSDIIVADLNHDGLSDFMVVYNSDAVKDDEIIFWSKGDGTFERQNLGNIIRGYTSSRVVDINGDGYQDLVVLDFVCCGSSHAEYYFLSREGGIFETKRMFGYHLESYNPSITVNTFFSKTGDFNGDGLADFLRIFPNDSKSEDILYSNYIPNPDVITSITNGHGLKTSLTYKPLTDDTVYTKGSGAEYPVKDDIAARYVVASVKADNAAGAQNEQTYKYAGLRTHQKGLGSLGFETITMTDVPTGVVTETTYNQNWQNHHQGLLKGTKKITSDGVVISEKAIEWAVRGFKDENGNFANCFRYIDNTTTIKRDLTGAFISREVETATFDDYGYKTTVQSAISNEDGTEVYIKKITNTYSHNSDTWRLGQLTQSVSESKQGHTEVQTTTVQETQTVTDTSTEEETFEGTISGWNDNTFYDGGATYTKFLGRNAGAGSSASQQIYKIFNIPANTSEVKLEFDLLEIGSWYNKQFTVFVNDQEAAVGTFVSDSLGNDSSPSSTSQGTGAIGSDDVEKHRFVVTIPVTPEQTTIKIGFGAPSLETTISSGWFGNTTYIGYWGVDNLSISSTYSYEQTIDVITETPVFVDDPTLSITNTSTFTYDTDGYLLSTTKEPGNALSHTATNTLNDYGVIEAVTETWGSTDTGGVAATSRTTSFEFDPKVRFVTKETNPLGHTETKTYHPILGIVASTTGPNGLTTSFEHDAFGRVTKETKADGTTTDSAMEFCSTDVPCPTGAVYRLRSVKSDGSEKLVYINKLNLEIKMSALLDNRWTHVVTEYDEIGREKRITQPHFDGETLHWTTNTYDILDRKTRVDRPDGSFQTATFNGLTQVSTNELGQTKTVTKNVIQKDAAITNHEGQVITYTYDGAGQLLTMTANGEVTSYAYDIRGNKISDSDPDKGTWTYRYNALGKIVEQTNAKGETTTMTYDVLDRMLSRIDDATGTNPSARTSSWEYDTATHGIGKIHKIISPTYTITNSYDTLGRPITTQETIDGENFTTSTTYDSQSRPDTTAYPSGVVTKNTYDAQGTLLTVANNNGSETWWERLEVDARGNVTKARHGNGVETMRTFDPTTGRLTSIYSYKGADVIQDLTYIKDYLGNLTRREDKRLNLVETFVYDNLNRVTQVDTTVAGSTNTVTMTYGITGNILTKSDVGAYTYGEVHASCGTSFAGPHAVTTVSGTKNATYCYDANGNMTSGDGRTTTYTAFDKPTQITKGGNTVNFYYGPDRKRFKRIDNTVADGTKTTIYAAGKAYERITDANGVQEKHYVGDFAVITKNTANGGTLRTSYMHRDHLGSVDVLTDETGTVQQRMSFDTWGKRREINWQQMTESAITTFDTSITTRGFTGHEQVDQVGLVHMNGRVYEPELGRFLSADPIIEAIDNLQTYNRYSYVRNNPVTLTDPSGFHSDHVDTGISTSGNFYEGGYFNFHAPGITQDNRQSTFEGIAGPRVFEVMGANESGQFAGMYPFQGMGFSDWSIDPGETQYIILAGKKGKGGSLSDILGISLDELTPNFVNEFFGYNPKLDAAAEKVEAERAKKYQKQLEKAFGTNKYQKYYNERTQGAKGGKRAYKKHTRGAINKARERNKAQNNGKLICKSCDKEMSIPQKRTKGYKVPDNEAQGDHIYPRSKGGDGATVDDQRNIDMKCIRCNLDKSDQIPDP